MPKVTVVPEGVSVDLRPDETILEGLPEPGRKGDPPFLIERMLVLAEEHRLRHHLVEPLRTTLVHDHPQCNPCEPRRERQSAIWPS